MGNETILPYFQRNRRKFLRTGVMAAACLLFPMITQKSFAERVPRERRLRCYNPHTGERLNVCYWHNGRYLDEELKTVNHFFRDFRTESVSDIDVRLLDLLHALFEKTSDGNSLHLISGYRSPETNRMLRAKSSGVARKSLHMTGQAADIRIPGVETKTVKMIAVNLGLGGVGYYPRSDFVHIDIGRVRRW